MERINKNVVVVGDTRDFMKKCSPQQYITNIAIDCGHYTHNRADKDVNFRIWEICVHYHHPPCLPQKLDGLIIITSEKYPIEKINSWMTKYAKRLGDIKVNIIEDKNYDLEPIFRFFE